jgi:hypothetical protein
MDQKRLRCIVTSLSGYELNSRERQFVDWAVECFTSKKSLTQQQESILEGIYREKMRWAKLGLITKRGAARG